MLTLQTTTTPWTSYAVDRNWETVGTFKTKKAMNAAAKALPKGTYYRGFSPDGHCCCVGTISQDLSLTASTTEAAEAKAKAEFEAYREMEREAPFAAAERDEKAYLKSLECPQDRY